MSDTWYFAYGSNMSVDQKLWRTGSIRAARRCRLPGYRLAFNKDASPRPGAYANIMPDESASVWGIAYLCDEAATDELDTCEGVFTKHYRRQQVEVITDSGEMLQAQAYVAEDARICTGRLPRRDYLETVLEGAREHGLPDEYIQFIEEIGTRRD